MSKQTTRKEATDKFVPSVGNESYLNSTPPEWEKIKHLWFDARSHAEKAILTFMDMGEILLKLREGTTDPVFGSLRKKYVPELSRQDAHRAMNMARNRTRFIPTKDAPLLSISAYSELVNASDEVIEKVLERKADPKQADVTVNEIREVVKNPETVDDFLNTIVPKSEPTTFPKVPTPPDPEKSAIDRVQRILTMSTRDRIDELASEELDINNSLLVLGINPLYDGDLPMTLPAFNAIQSWLYENIEQDEATVVETCAKTIYETLYK